MQDRFLLKYGVLKEGSYQRWIQVSTGNGESV